MLDRFKEFELKIKTENLPLSIKYEYLKSLNELLKTYEYSFFAFEEGFNSLRKSFNHDVYVFNKSISITFNYLKEKGNFLNVEQDSFIYNFLLKNIGVLIFMKEDYRAYDIVSELLLEKKFNVFKISDDYILKLEEIFLHLKKYGDLPVQTDREFKLKCGTYMGSFLAHNKKRIYMLKDGNEYAYAISEYFEKKYLSFEDRLKEVYEYLVYNGSLPYIGDNRVRFSNGEVISYFISHNRKKISLTDNDIAKEITIYLNSRRLNFNDKLEELYVYIINNNEVKSGLFSDGSFIGMWLSNNKRKIYYDDIMRNILLKIDENYFSKLKFNDKKLVKKI